MQFSLILIYFFACCDVAFIRADKHFVRPRFEAEKWLKGYETINISATFMLGEVAHLQFSYGKKYFQIFTVKKNIVKNTTFLSVDGDRVDFNNVIRQLQLYQGLSSENGTSVECTVLVTKYGLEGMFKLGNDSFIIEPIASAKTYTVKQQSRTETFLCIIYQPKDIKIENSSHGIIQDELFAKVYTLPNRVKKRNTYYTDCSLHIVADHTFYQKAGHEDVISTISAMLYFVTEANTVFRGTDFDGDGRGDNVGFYVSHISVFTEGSNYNMADTSLSVYRYLDAFSEYDFSEFCLGVAFSCRDFADGVLGLAWVASSNAYGSAGGVCERRLIFDNTEYSLNTNIITLFNGGERVPTYKSSITLTHELGHSFGSPHDDISDVSCVPNDDFGNYIMYPYANDGSKPNHNQFSSCSIGYMFPVIRNKGTCFTSSAGVCGNGIKEEHEECDCGSISTCDLIDPCCTPSDTSTADSPCTVRRVAGYQCSRISSPCCTATCQFAASDKICRLGGECIKFTKCDGISGECPDIDFESDEKLCDSNRRTCRSGKCVGSLCSLFNTSECECAAGPHECHSCCLFDGLHCLPAFINNSYIQKSVGSACHQMQGFCDKNAICIQQDPDSVIKRLNEVFSPKSMNEVGIWMQNHWYYIVAVVAALLFVAGIFIATCRQRLDVQTSAYMYGQFMRIHRESELQKHYIENRQKIAKSKYAVEAEKLEKGCVRMSLPKAVARLKVFFPTAPSKELEKALKLSSKEEMAVSLLLMKGYPFRRISGTVHSKA